MATLAATGLILAIGLLIAPGAIAFLLTRRFGRILVIASASCFTTMMTGIRTSFWLVSPPAAPIILVLTAMFLLAFFRRSLQIRAQGRARTGHLCENGGRPRFQCRPPCQSGLIRPQLIPSAVI